MGHRDGSVMRRPPKYVHGFLDRHGKPRFYFRRAGFRRVPLPGLPWSPEFMAAYEAALKGEAAAIEIGASRTKPGSVDDAVVRYCKSTAFQSLAPATQDGRRTYLERFRREHGDKQIKMLGSEHVGAILAKLRPFAQRNMLKALRGLTAFALTEQLINSDPTTGHKGARGKDTGGYKTWPQECIDLYRERHELGSKARLALELLLNIGARRSDTVKLGPQHLRGGEFTFRAQKNGMLIEGLPVLPELDAAIKAMPNGEHLAYLMTEYGKPFSAKGFGGWLSDRCKEAGIPKGYSAHGLRKHSATRLAEEGATTNQLMAWFGWKSSREAERYTRAAQRKKLARSAGALISGTKTGKP
jgi:integrase